MSRYWIARAVRHNPMADAVIIGRKIKKGQNKTHQIGGILNQAINPNKIRNELIKSISYPNTGAIGITIRRK